MIHSTAASGTISVGDLVNGGSGTDSMTVRLVGTTPDLSASTSPTLTSIEDLTIVPLAANSTANLSIAASVSKLNIEGPVGTFGVTNIPGAALDVSLTDIATDHADQTLTYKSGSLTGSADSLTLRVSGLSSSTTGTANTYAELTIRGATTSQGFETVNVVTSGADSRLDSLTVSDGTTSTMKTLVVTGTHEFRVNTALDATVRTIDSSKMTGSKGVNVGVTAGNDVTLIGGSGNDRINMAGGLTTTDSLVGGAGTDTLAISQTDGFAAATDTIVKAIKAQSGFERLEFTNTDVDTVTLSALSTIDYFVISGAQAENLALSGVENADTVSFTASTSIAAPTAGGTGSAGTAGADALTISPELDGGSNVFNLVLNGVTIAGQAGAAVAAGTGGTAGAGGDAIDAPLIEVVNIVSTGSSATATNSLLGGDAGAAGTNATAGSAGESLIVGTNVSVNITGANDLTIESLVGTNVTINAGTFTGKLNVRVQDAATGVSNDVITGGTGNDTIFGGDGIDQIDLTKGGEDTIGLVAVTASATEGASLAAVAAAADRDIITGFTTGSGSGFDSLDVDGSLGTTELAEVTAAAASYTITSTNAITEFAFNANLNSADLSIATDGTELLKGLGTGGALSGFTGTANDTGYILAYYGGDAYLYYYADGNNNTTIAAGEIALIARLVGETVGSLTDANFS